MTTTVTTIEIGYLSVVIHFPSVSSARYKWLIPKRDKGKRITVIGLLQNIWWSQINCVPNSYRLMYGEQ